MQSESGAARKTALWRCGAYTVRALLPLREDATAVWLHLSGEEAEAYISALSSENVAALCIEGADWDRDFSPWPAKAAFRGGEDFSGGAGAYLQTLTEKLLPGAESAFGLRPGKRAIAGYSLSGLFALYALMECDSFQGAISASGSLWYDGFEEYLCEKANRASKKAVYLSLGDTEARTKNARLSSVAERTRFAEARLRESGARVVFEWNPGGHFADPQGRLVKGIRKCIRMMEDI